MQAPTAAEAQTEPLPTPLAGGEVLYIVEAGDTLPLISERFAISIETLADLNGLSADSPLKTGQRIILGLAGDASPAEQPAEVVEPTSAPVEQAPPVKEAPPVDLYRSTPTPQADGRIFYLVQPGDTLISIAVRFGFTLDELYAASGLNQTSLLTLGQAIELGVDRGSVVLLEGNIPPRYTGATYREADKTYVHKVQPDETLIEIALQYQYKTMDDFYVVSGLDAGSLIAVGQDVIVGYKPVPASQGGSTDAPTNTPASVIPITNTPEPVVFATRTPVPFPTALPTATLSPEQAAFFATRDAAEGGSAEITSTSQPLPPSSIFPAFIALFGSFVLLLVLAWYLWSRQKR
ncbi:MAG: LysM peptidoglycan-binding domain-containing protein [Candidatus Promineifilaceae bacterium]